MKENELRELDAFCAERVMGYREHDREQGTWHDANGALFGFHPAINTADAFLVLEKCIDWTPQTICVGRYHKPHEPKRYVVHLGGTWEKTRQDGETLPLAICKFAKALFSDKDKP